MFLTYFHLITYFICHIDRMSQNKLYILLDLNNYPVSQKAETCQLSSILIECYICIPFRYYQKCIKINAYPLLTNGKSVLIQTVLVVSLGY